MRSFGRILLERLIQQFGITNYRLRDGDTNPSATIRKTAAGLVSPPIDIAFDGSGESGYLAFNHPPANFETEKPYPIVELDEACRRQRVGEGWFNNIFDVPERTISMSVQQILKAGEIVAALPALRTANAVHACLVGGVCPMAPAPILRTQDRTSAYLDGDSAALFTQARPYAQKGQR